MTWEQPLFVDDNMNVNPLNAMQSLRGVLTEQEEIVFMNLLFSSSATIRGRNFGLSRKDIEKMLTITTDHEFFSFLTRINEAISRYFKVIYDEKRGQVIVLLRVPPKAARTTFSKESLAILLFMFYQQEVLNHATTTFEQLLAAFGHETTRANHKLFQNLAPLKRIGAIDEIETEEDGRKYQLTAIGAHLFSDSFLRRSAEFSQSNQLSKEDVLKFFRRYNFAQKEGE